VDTSVSLTSRMLSLVATARLETSGDTRMYRIYV
jgi:hypothetical protein